MIIELELEIEIKLEQEHSNPRMLRKLQGYGLNGLYDNSVSYTSPRVRIVVTP